MSAGPVDALVETLKHAAEAGGWTLLAVEWSNVSISRYITLTHPRRPDVVVRVSDHKARRKRRRERVLLSVLVGKPQDLERALSYLAKPPALARLKRPAPTRRSARDFRRA